MLSYAKSATARPGDRLNGFKNGKSQLFNSRGGVKWAYFQKVECSFNLKQFVDGCIVHLTVSQKQHDVFGHISVEFSAERRTQRVLSWTPPELRILLFSWEKNKHMIETELRLKWYQNCFQCLKLIWNIIKYKCFMKNKQKSEICCFGY